MGAQIVEAARATGLGLTLLPVLYTYSGFGGAPPTPAQRRFVNTPDAFVHLVEASQRHVASLPTANLGIAPHSLRAVDEVGLRAAIELAGSRPIHMHIAEQVREVEDCVAWSGQRPVEWLLHHANVNERWCPIHATHMTPDEIGGLARSGAVAGLCPVTEANLGDGVFNAVSWLDAEGAIGFGTDSNVAIGVTDEVKQLEYSVRLQQRSRNALAGADMSTGRRLFGAGLAGGAQATGTRAGIEIGNPADLVSLDLGHPSLIGRINDQLLDAWIFGRSAGAIDAVYVAGREVVREGRHTRRGDIMRRYRERVTPLLAA